MWNSQSKQWKKPSNFKIELVNHNINMIMQSELLLDQDEQIIDTYWSPIATEAPRNHLKWMNSAIALSGTMIAIRCKSWKLIVASCIPAAIKAAYDCYNGLRLRKHKMILKKLIFLLKEQYDLNHVICEYYRKHINVLVDLSDDKRCDSIVTAIRKQEKEFADVAVNNILKICLEIQKNLHDIKITLGVKQNNYNVMSNLDLESLLQVKAGAPSSLLTDNLNTFTNLSKFYDAYGLLMSSFLGCLALSMSLNIWRDADKFNSLLYHNIPKMSNVLEKYISETKDSFKNLQDSVIEQPTPIRPHFVSNARHSEVFIFNSLADYIYNIQLAYDITRSIQQKIIDRQEPNATDMKAMLEDILKHNKSSSKCIEIVIKMNEIIARGAKLLPIILPHSSDPEALEEYDEEEYLDINLRSKLMPKGREYHSKGNEKSPSGDNLDNAPSATHQIPQRKLSKQEYNESLAKNNCNGFSSSDLILPRNLPLMPIARVNYYAVSLDSIARRVNHSEKDYEYCNSSGDESVEDGSEGDETDDEEEL